MYDSNNEYPDNDLNGSDLSDDSVVSNMGELESDYVPETEDIIDEDWSVSQDAGDFSSEVDDIFDAQDTPDDILSIPQEMNNSNMEADDMSSTEDIIDDNWDVSSEPEGSCSEANDFSAADDLIDDEWNDIQGEDDLQSGINEETGGEGAFDEEWNEPTDINDDLDSESDDAIDYEEPWPHNSNQEPATDMISETDTEEEKTYPFDREEWHQRGLNAIEANVEELREDYLDKGYEEGEELDALIAQERANMINEFESDFNSGLNSNQDRDSLLNTDIQSDGIYNELDGTNTDNSMTFDNMDHSVTSSDSEINDFSESVDTSDNAVGFEEADLTDEDNDFDEKTYPFDREEWHQRGLNAVEANVEELREDYLDKGYEEGEELDALLDQERANMINEFERNFNGDLSSFHESSDGITDSDNLSDMELNSDIPSEKENVIPESADETLHEEYSQEGEDDYLDHGTNTPIEAEEIQTTDLLNDAGSDEVEIPPEMDEDLIYNGQDDYDLDGIDITNDSERINPILSEFDDDKWANQDLDTQKENIQNLADYVQENIGLTEPPTIEYYYNPDPTDYGGYVHSNNTLLINEFNLDDNDEAVDTVAHELWHAYQYQCAESPRPGVSGSIDWQRQYGLDPQNYIKPLSDSAGRCINFDEYQDQFVEAEARAFAAQVKNYFRQIKGGNYHG